LFAREPVMGAALDFFEQRIARVDIAGAAALQYFLEGVLRGDRVVLLSLSQNVNFGTGIVPGVAKGIGDPACVLAGATSPDQGPRASLRVVKLDNRFTGLIPSERIFGGLLGQDWGH